MLEFRESDAFFSRNSIEVEDDLFCKWCYHAYFDQTKMNESK